MTEAHLKNAIKISDEIKIYKNFLKAFDKPYSNRVVAFDWNGDISADRYLILENEPELKQLIRDYVKRKIEALEKDFAEL